MRITFSQCSPGQLVFAHNEDLRFAPSRCVSVQDEVRAFLPSRLTAQPDEGVVRLVTGDDWQWRP
jgi:hypothetical protein